MSSFLSVSLSVDGRAKGTFEFGVSICKKELNSDIKDGIGTDLIGIADSLWAWWSLTISKLQNFLPV